MKDKHWNVRISRHRGLATRWSKPSNWIMRSHWWQGPGGNGGYIRGWYFFGWHIFAWYEEK